MIATNHSNHLELHNIETLTTWWSYGFGMSTIEYAGHGTEGKSRAHINKIYIYAKFESGQDYLILKEEIHLGDKFPNNHHYINHVDIDRSKVTKVWDVDKCIQKINFSIRS